MLSKNSSIFDCKILLQKIFLLYLLVLTLSFSCSQEGTVNTAVLEVKSTHSGEYSLFKVERGFNLSLAKKYLGFFNKPISLPAGNYLLLTKCSSQEVILKSGEATRLNLQTIIFAPPLAAKNDDAFSVACHNNPFVNQVKNYENQFAFHFFSKKNTIFVQKKKLELDFLEKKTEVPLNTTIQLSALRVTSLKDPKNFEFFISPAQFQPKSTIAQRLNQWSFLLPGSYDLELNGTKRTVTLGAGENKSFEVGYLSLEDSKYFDQSLIIEKWGKPLLAYLNEEHLVFWGESVPLFPGPYTLNFTRSTERAKFTIEASLTKTQTYKTLQIQSICMKKKDACDKRVEVLLYHPDEKIHFMSGHTDITMPYFADVIDIEFKRSRGLRYRVAGGKSHQDLKVATVILKPIHIYNPSLETEFVRLEPNNSKVMGFSHDISFKRPTTMDLIAGKYKVVSYLKPKVEGDERKKIYHNIQLSPYDEKEKTFPYYLSKRQYDRLKRQNKLR